MEGDMIEKGTRKFMVSYGGICGGALIRYLLYHHYSIYDISFYRQNDMLSKSFQAS